MANDGSLISLGETHVSVTARWILWGGGVLTQQENLILSLYSPLLTLNEEEDLLSSCMIAA